MACCHPLQHHETPRGSPEPNSHRITCVAPAWVSAPPPEPPALVSGALFNSFVSSQNQENLPGRVGSELPFRLFAVASPEGVIPVERCADEGHVLRCNPCAEFRVHGHPFELCPKVSDIRPASDERSLPLPHVIAATARITRHEGCVLRHCLHRGQPEPLIPRGTKRDVAPLLGAKAIHLKALVRG